jgi:hypothetical protein
MPNDAKFGLFAGVIGVIVAAIVTMNQQPPTNPITPSPVTSTATATPNTKAKPATPDANSHEPASTPVVRTRKDPDGTTTSRAPMDDVEW